VNQNRKIEILLIVLLVIVLLTPRVVDLVKFTAADEPFWMVVGANYYYAISHHEFEKTVYEYHPAVTTMWIVTGAMLIYFPEYRGFGQGYFDQEKTKFEDYLVEHGKSPLGLLWWSRFLQLLVNVSLLVVVFFLLKFMFDPWIAFSVVLLASFSPYLFGQSRMLNHESMVGLFSLISTLAMATYLFRDRKLLLLILSGGAAAYANLTKSSAIFLLPLIGVIIFVWTLVQWREQKKNQTGNMFIIFFSWLLILLAVYVISWPGMWVAPGKMLYEVYGNAFSYAFQGARLSVTQGLKPSSFSLNSAGAGILSLLVSILWRTTPVTWLGVFLAIVVLFHKDFEWMPSLVRYLIAFLLLMAFACITLFAIARGRDQPHYVLTAYYGFEFASALGWVFILRWLAGSRKWIGKPMIKAALFSVVLCLQAGGLIYNHPY
jgi:4-amino-4-deoxy-L-arabinose transferase-like glycosyltransferase